MVNNLTINECLKQIQSAKGRNRRICKIKISQVEYFKDKHPKIFLQTMGVFKCIDILQKSGYSCNMEKNDKQVTTGYNMRGEIRKCVARDLHTTILVIKW